MSKLSDAAFEWLKINTPAEGTSTKTLWHGMRDAYPNLTQISETRKTPRNTLIRDLRLDPWDRFDVNNGHVKIVKFDWKPGNKTTRQLMKP